MLLEPENQLSKPWGGAPSGLRMTIAPHAELWTLQRGDPMLRLAHPQEASLKAAAEAYPGERLRVEGRCDMSGRGVLELVCRRDCRKHEPPLRERFDPTDKALAAYQSVYEQSLDRCWARWSLNLPEGDFATEVVIPTDAHGPCHLRLLVANEHSQAMGATNIYLRPAPIATANATQRAGNSTAQ